jgi:sigma-B regulation protein RsbU (phosphoserine phosphatase)
LKQSWSTSKLSEKELQHERDKVEYERRAKELEEARQLQLSMLPKKLPQLPNLEIAAYMKPATEVGGDYYDFTSRKMAR